MSHVVVVVLLLVMIRAAVSFMIPSKRNIPFERVWETSSSLNVDVQSNSDLYGRGDRHLSAILEDDDVAVYQTGTWLVDGVEVGDGTDAAYKYARVESLQIVWTHNCEHGVIRGVAVELVKSDGGKSWFALSSPMEQIEFGPEQLVARIQVDWNDADEGICSERVNESLWKES